MTLSELLEGVWNITSLEVNGSVMSEAMISGAQIIMAGGRFNTRMMGGAYCGAYEVDETSSPSRLDLRFTEGPHAGLTSPAIFHLDGDDLRICLGLAGMSRPEAFVTSPGSGHALETLRRDPKARADFVSPVTSSQTAEAHPEIIPSTDGDAAAIENEQRLEGEWQMVAGEMEGESLPPEFAAGGRRVNKGNVVTVTFSGQQFLKAAYSLDPTTSPKSVDYTVLAGPNNGKVQLGIYELNGDDFRICYSAFGKPRPTEFSTAPGDGRTMGVWKRAGGSG